MWRVVRASCGLMKCHLCTSISHGENRDLIKHLPGGANPTRSDSIAGSHMDIQNPHTP